MADVGVAERRGVVVKVKGIDDKLYWRPISSLLQFRNELHRNGSIAVYRTDGRHWQALYMTAAGVAFFWELAEAELTDDQYRLLQEAADAFEIKINIPQIDS